jgi:hypothetical protein
MKDLSRRSFGKGISVGALGGLAASIATPLARAQGEVTSSKSSPKRMTTVLRELIQGPGILDFSKPTGLLVPNQKAGSHNSLRARFFSLAFH